MVDFDKYKETPKVSDEGDIYYTIGLFLKYLTTFHCQRRKLKNTQRIILVAEGLKFTLKNLQVKY